MLRKLQFGRGITIVIIAISTFTSILRKTRGVNEPTTIRFQDMPGTLARGGGWSQARYYPRSEISALSHRQELAKARGATAS